MNHFRGSVAGLLILAGAALAASVTPAVNPTEEGAATVAGQRWQRITLCSSLGPVSVELPGEVTIDGPRDLRNLDAPAVGTFAMSYGPDEELRYDALVIDRADRFESNDRDRLRYVLEHLDGDPDAITLGPIEKISSHLEVPYDEIFNDRRLDAYGFGRGGVVVAVNVGRYPSTSADTTRLAHLDLERIRRSIVAPGLDDGRERPCTGPTTAPVDDQDGDPR